MPGLAPLAQYGGFLPGHPKSPGRLPSCCHQNPCWVLDIAGSSQWKVGPSCRCCACLGAPSLSLGAP